MHEAASRGYRGVVAATSGNYGAAVASQANVGGSTSALALAKSLGREDLLVPAILLVVMTGVYASMWGTPKLNPGLVGLLFMTEISVGAITAALWSGDPFGWREVIGIILISAAGMMESLWELWRGRRAVRQLPPASSRSRLRAMTRRCTWLVPS